MTGWLYVDARSVRCEHCGAGPGDACRQPSERFSRQPHLIRLRQFRSSLGEAVWRRVYGPRVRRYR